ncbi:hypothetical protein H4582DRAFT_2131062 [Lactarius indigo]|nr:hypothetical protein H4582DRAFT_2131062 [Lactarius indigo]
MLQIFQSSGWTTWMPSSTCTHVANKIRMDSSTCEFAWPAQTLRAIWFAGCCYKAVLTVVTPVAKQSETPSGRMVFPYTIGVEGIETDTCVRAGGYASLPGHSLTLPRLLTHGSLLYQVYTFRHGKYVHKMRKILNIIIDGDIENPMGMYTLYRTCASKRFGDVKQYHTNNGKAVVDDLLLCDRHLVHVVKGLRWLGPSFAWIEQITEGGSRASFSLRGPTIGLPIEALEAVSTIAKRWDSGKDGEGLD